MVTVAERLVETLEAAGVRRIYGLVGDSLNGITESLRTREKIEWMAVRHEEVAAFAAGADAQLTDELAVCAGSCGPGNLHLINGLFDCHRNRVPVVAIAAHIPSTETGSGYFQETHPQILFKECSHYVELVTDAAHVPRIVETAIREAVTKRGVAVIVISGDIALREAGAQQPSANLIPRTPKCVAQDGDIKALADLLNDSNNVTLFCGAGCAGAHDEVVALAARLKAPVVHALRGKEHVEWDNPYDVGMTGLIGFSSGYHAMGACDTLLMLGTDFPYRQFYPEHARIAQVDIRGENLGKRCRLELGVIGEVKDTVTRLLEQLDEKTDDSHLQVALDHYKEARAGLDALALGTSRHRRIHPQLVAKIISDTAAEDAIVTCDVGEPTVWAARYLRVNGKRRLLGSFLHGSMANAMPQAIGAQTAFPDRQVISMSGDGGFTMLMGDLLTLRQSKLPIKIVVFNNGLLGFVDIEMKAGGFLPVGTHLDNPDFAKVAQAMGIHGVRVEDPALLGDAIKEAFAHDGPALIDVVTDPLELVMPPKITVDQAKGFSVWMMKAVLNAQASEIVELARTAFDR
ncbi:ubiquinone-dependent pyruvate dehydrogenase [Paraburkholderia madseniana]|jgi:pyruvate dehydrogenase (quinone)|uniref:Pyruvate dehydrogenase [ubiquinone] n=1 Tax=Paraburkholderia madseniana TaxID=2599607 RepID=A0A6N6WLG7_9BURK|nr:ubiquinone-dependent pyruvate dehydrogenase [Paraburkholderia madseniana]KAE8761485.1 ubiquinone-dependent pyruvate dehydrogenase [Paraburkholderia madseniana]